MSNIALSAGVRSNLQSLRGTAELLAVSQNRLATGKRVNSALDNPTNFFTAKSMADKARGLNGLLDGMSNGIQTIKAADRGLQSITKAIDTVKGLIDQAKANAGSSTNVSTGGLKGLTAGTLLSAAAPDGPAIAANDTLVLEDTVTGGVFTVTVTDPSISVSQFTNLVSEQTGGAYTANLNADGALQINSTNGNAFTATSAVAIAFDLATPVETANYDADKLANFAKQINDQLVQINEIARDSGFNGVNLLEAGASLKIAFSEDGKSSVTLNGVGTNAEDLGLVAVTNPVSSLSDITGLEAAIDGAKKAIQIRSSELGTQMSTIQNRQEFSRGMVDILNVGADNLVNADPNEEAANVLALQTRQQLSQTALSLAVEADRSVLRLF
jgi:flagellin